VISLTYRTVQGKKFSVMYAAASSIPRIRCGPLPTTFGVLSNATIVPFLEQILVSCVAEAYRPAMTRWLDGPRKIKSRRRAGIDDLPGGPRHGPSLRQWPSGCRRAGNSACGPFMPLYVQRHPALATSTPGGARIRHHWASGEPHSCRRRLEGHATPHLRCSRRSSIAPPTPSKQNGTAISARLGSRGKPDGFAPRYR